MKTATLRESNARGRQLARAAIFTACVAGAGMLAPGGCAEKPRVAALPVDPQESVIRATPLALQDTIGEYAVFIDSAPIAVEGYGVVAYLPHTGSPQADPKVHDYLLNQLRIRGVGMYSNGTEDISPERILDSDQVAFVEVRGLIPPLAKRGSTFDVYVNAVPDSGATSLSNGLLWSSDLKVRGLTLNGDDTATIAMGRGPLFLPGPLEDIASGKVDDGKPKTLRTARVVAGGVVSEDRVARLQLYRRDRYKSKLVERIINSRFPNRDKVADAIDDSIINLKIPAEYADHATEFVELIQKLYLSPAEPGFIQEKAKELVEALAAPDAPHRDLGIALQGLGRAVLLDNIQPNYNNPNQHVRFWCAGAGAMMQDINGMITLQDIIRERENPYRLQAVSAMIEASRGHDTDRATVTLEGLLESHDENDQILAYHAMLAIRSKAIASFSVGKKFVIDLLPADCPPLIYVLESDSPRIAFIGQTAVLPAGSVFMSDDKLLTVLADEQGAAALPPAMPEGTPVKLESTDKAGAKPKLKENVTLYWRAPLGDKTVTLRSEAGLASIVARATWVPDARPERLANDPRRLHDTEDPFIGATYQRMTEMLAAMCRDKTVTARIVIQHAPDQVTNPTDIALSGRPDGSTLPKVPAPAGATAGSWESDSISKMNDFV